MVEKKQLNIRLPVELYERMSNSEGSMVGIIEAALRKHFDSPDGSEDVSHLLTEVEYLRGENTKLLELLSREQIKGMDLQKKLMPSQDESKKRGGWWRFW